MKRNCLSISSSVPLSLLAALLVTIGCSDHMDVESTTSVGQDQGAQIQLPVMPLQGTHDSFSEKTSTVKHAFTDQPMQAQTFAFSEKKRVNENQKFAGEKLGIRILKLPQANPILENQLRRLGPITTIEDDFGISVLVGQYENINQARHDLPRLQAAGFTDATIEALNTHGAFAEKLSAIREQFTAIEESHGPHCNHSEHM